MELRPGQVKESVEEPKVRYQVEPEGDRELQSALEIVIEMTPADALTQILKSWGDRIAAGDVIAAAATEKLFQVIRTVRPEVLESLRAKKEEQ